MKPLHLILISIIIMVYSKVLAQPVSNNVLQDSLATKAEENKPFSFKYPNPLQFKTGDLICTLNAYADMAYVAGVNNSRDSIIQADVNSSASTDSVYKRKYSGLRDYTSYPQYGNTFSMPYSYIQTTFEVPSKFRFRFAFHAGHIVESLYAEELVGLRMIREFATTYYFTPKLSIEAGIFPSYYGFEVMVTRDNMNLSRSYVSDYAPDYEAGARLSYQFTKYVVAKAMFYNGWQEIKDKNGKKGYGLYFHYDKQGTFYLNYLNYFGDMAEIGEKRKLRFYHNLVAKYWLGDRIIIAPAIDYVIEEKVGSGGVNSFFGPAISTRYKLNEKNGVCFRWDQVKDKNSMIPELYTGSIYGWQSNSYTLTYEYKPNPIIMFRAEGRITKNMGKVFRGSDNKPSEYDGYFILSLSAQL